MIRNIANIKYIIFEEHNVAAIRSNNNPYEITLEHSPSFTSFVIKGEFSDELYCRCVVMKIYELPKRKWKELFSFQIQNKIDPHKWISQVEDLFKKNMKFFREEGEESFYSEVMTLVGAQIDELKLLELDPKLKFKYPPAVIKALDLYQTSILFDYLKGADAILPYDNKSLAKLLHHLTGHSEQNIRTNGLAHIHTIKNEVRAKEGKHNLKKVKTLIEGLLAQINSDLK